MRASIAQAGALPARPVGTGALVVAANVARLAARASFYALVILMPLRARIVVDLREPEGVWDEYTSFFLYWSDIALIGVLGFWLISLALHRRPLYFGPPLLRWPALAFLAVVWLSSAFSVDPDLSAYMALRMTSLLLLALFVCNEFDNLRQIVPAAGLVVLSQSIIGLAQFLQQSGIGLDRLSEFELLDPYIPGASVVWTPSLEPLLRAYGLTDHPNVLGGILAASMLLLLPGASRRPVFFALITVVFAVGAAALLLSFSRGAMLGAALGATLIFGLMAYRRFWAQAEHWLLVCLTAGVVCAAIAGAYAPYLEVRASPRPAQEGAAELRSIDEREALIRLTSDIFADHALTGVGAGAVSTSMARDYPHPEYVPQPAHNVLITVAAETGVAGLALFVLLLLAPWVLLVLQRHALTPELIVAAGALLAVIVAGVFDYYPWGLQPGRVLTGLTFGVFALAYRGATEATDTRRQTAMGVSSNDGN